MWNVPNQPIDVDPKTAEKEVHAFCKQALGGFQRYSIMLSELQGQLPAAISLQAELQSIQESIQSLIERSFPFDQTTGDERAAT